MEEHEELSEAPLKELEKMKRGQVNSTPYETVRGARYSTGENIGRGGGGQNIA